MEELDYIVALERDFADAINRTATLDELSDYLGARYISLVSDTEKPECLYSQRNRHRTRNLISIEHISKILQFNARRKQRKAQDKREAEGRGGKQKDLRPPAILDQKDSPSGPC